MQIRPTRPRNCPSHEQAGLVSPPSQLGESACALFLCRGERTMWTLPLPSSCSGWNCRPSGIWRGVRHSVSSSAQGRRRQHTGTPDGYGGEELGQRGGGHGAGGGEHPDLNIKGDAGPWRSMVARGAWLRRQALQDIEGTSSHLGLRRRPNALAESRLRFSGRSLAVVPKDTDGPALLLCSHG